MNTIVYRYGPCAPHEYRDPALLRSAREYRNKLIEIERMRRKIIEIERVRRKEIT